MSMSSEPDDEVGAWCDQHRLTEETRQVLKNEGFTSLQYLRLLTPGEVDKSFKHPKLLPLAQSLALQHAVTQLRLNLSEHSQLYALQRQDSKESRRDYFGQRQDHIGQRQDSQDSRHDYSEQRRDHRGQRTDNIGLRDDYTGRRLDSLEQEPNFTPLGNKLQGREHIIDSSAACLRNADGGATPETEEQLSWFSTVSESKHQTYSRVNVLALEGGVDESSVFYDQDEPYRFLLVGKTGSGKSTTGNIILGAELFDADVAFDSQTHRNQLKRGYVNGKLVEIMDSPGLFDTARTHEEISVDIVNAVACMHPGPHAILYVIRLGRYTEEEFQVYKRLKALFDEEVTRHIIIVFTGGDGLEKEAKDIKEVLRKVPASLNKVLQECQHRLVVFNNVTDKTQPYVRQLLQEVEKLMIVNGGRHYTCPKYADVGHGIEEEVAKRLDELEEKELASKPYVQELKRKAKATEDNVQEERRNFEQREKDRQSQLRMAEEEAKAEMEKLTQEMKEKDLTMEQQQAERKRLLEQHQKAREELERELEMQKQQDQMEMEKKQQELELQVKRMQEEHRMAKEKRAREYTRKMGVMKDQIAQGQQQSFLDKFVTGVKGIVGTITSFFMPLKSDKGV